MSSNLCRHKAHAARKPIAQSLLHLIPALGTHMACAAQGADDRRCVQLRAQAIQSMSSPGRPQPPLTDLAFLISSCITKSSRTRANFLVSCEGSGFEGLAAGWKGLTP